MNNNSILKLNVVDPNDPMTALAGRVIAIEDKTGKVVRGRLIKWDDRVVWIQKISGTFQMISQDFIASIFIISDRKKAVV